jgi:hypothetical protein
MNGATCTITAYALGLGLFLLYALRLWQVHRATARGDGE